jgi:beta-glucosidase
MTQNHSPDPAIDPAIDPLIDALAGTDMWHTAPVAGLPVMRMSDGPAGVRGTSFSGPASASFPCGTALAATFDPELVRQVGAALAREAQSKSAQVLLAPTVNLHRTPIGGRNFECMSEDPVHTAAIATAYIQGVQGGGVACCVKHFVGNDTEFARFVVSSEIPERLLREVYLVPFEAAVAVGVRSIMTGYNRLNGTFCSEHEWLLDQVLRGEWGFDGVVISDWYGTHSTVPALLAGLDIEMPGPPLHRGDKLRAALAGADEEQRILIESAIAASVERLRALAQWTNAASAGAAEVTADDPATRAVSRRAAAASMVLLTNRDDALPLRPGASLALIGPYAGTGRVQGGGSAQVRADQPSALLPALIERGFQVSHARGCVIDKSVPILQGQFRFHLTDAHGGEAIAQQTRLQLIRQHSEPDGLSGDVGARITGTFTVDTTGDWEIGLRAVGAATVTIDGNAVIALDGTEPLGSFYGFGSKEVIGRIHLEADIEHHLEVSYPPSGGEAMCGVMVGARPADQPDLIGEAVALATSSDVAVVVVGTNEEWETEGEDRLSLVLPGDQDALVAAVLAANPNTIVVVNAGSPVTMPWVDRVPATLQMWFPGGQLGLALTDVLSGDVEPGGRLPVTFPRQLSDTPAAAYHPGDGVRAEYGEGHWIGHRWYRHQGIDPLFWFGHGLGYTTFELGSTVLDGTPAEGATVTTEARNTGSRSGHEVVQVYLRYQGDHPDMEPVLRFVGSAKVFADPGEQVTATVVLPRRAFESWLDQRWQIPTGSFEVLVGRSAGSAVGIGRLADR